MTRCRRRSGSHSSGSLRFRRGPSEIPRRVNDDFVEMLSALSDAGADFLIVGAHALGAHGVVRATGDLDIWVRPTPVNATRVWNALTAFGAPLDQLTETELAEPELVFQIGLPPRRIDLLTSITGVSFEDAWPRRMNVQIGAMQVPVLDRDTLIHNKLATGRPRDLADVSELTDLQDGERS
jgi:hypothetical protein